MKNNGKLTRILSAILAGLTLAIIASPSIDLFSSSLPTLANDYVFFVKSQNSNNVIAQDPRTFTTNSSLSRIVTPTGISGLFFADITHHHAYYYSSNSVAFNNGQCTHLKINRANYDGSNTQLLNFPSSVYDYLNSRFIPENEQISCFYAFQLYTPPVFDIAHKKSYYTYNGPCENDTSDNCHYIFQADLEGNNRRVAIDIKELANNIFNISGLSNSSYVSNFMVDSLRRKIYFLAGADYSNGSRKKRLFSADLDGTNVKIIEIAQFNELFDNQQYTYFSFIFMLDQVSGALYANTPKGSFKITVSDNQNSTPTTVINSIEIPNYSIFTSLFFDSLNDRLLAFSKASDSYEFYPRLRAFNLNNNSVTATSSVADPLQESYFFPSISHCDPRFPLLFQMPAYVPNGAGQFTALNGENCGSDGYVDTVVLPTPTSTNTPVQTPTKTSTPTATPTKTPTPVPPSAPGIPDLKTESDTGKSTADNVTTDNTPTFSVSCMTGNTVRLKAATALVGSTPCISSLAVITSSALSDGAYGIQATQVNAAGIESVASIFLPITIDRLAPNAPGTPDLTAASDNGTSNTDNITTIKTPTLTVACLAGNTVQLIDNGTSIKTASCSSSSVSITTSTLTVGAHVMRAKHVDTAGNVSVASKNLTVTIK